MTTGLEIAMGLLTGAECGHILYGRLPSRMTTRKFADEHDKKQNLMALYESICFGTILALIIAIAMRSWLVFIIAMVILLGVSALYLNDIYRWWS